MKEHKPPFKNIREVWEDRVKRYSDNVLLICAEDDSKHTYKEMYDGIKRTANLMHRYGIKKGDKIAILTTNIPEFFYMFYGAIIIGAVPAPINYSYKTEEIEFQLNHSESKLIFVEKEFLDKFKQVKNLKHTKTVIGVRCDKEDMVLYEEELKKEPIELKYVPDIEPEDDAYLSYTSGTTGVPKGILHTHKNIIISWDVRHGYVSLGVGDSWLCTQQLYYQDHLFYFGYPFYVGATLVLPKKFSKSRFWEWIKKYKTKYALLFPTMASILLKEPEKVTKEDVSHVECFFIGGSAVSIELVKKFEKTFHVLLFEGCGLNETVIAITINPRDVNKRKLGSIGLATDYFDIKVFDENDKELGVNQDGEIVVRGPSLMKGYYKDPKGTKEVMRGGWFHTGDCGHHDKDGFFYIVGRIKHLIKKGGAGVSPVEVDGVIHKHEAVHQSVSIGVPDDVLGEEIKSYVVLKKSYKGKVTEQDIKNYCKKHLADIKCPRYVRFLDEIPLSHVHKPDIKKLKAMHKA